MAFTPRLSDSGMLNNSLWYSNNPFYNAGYGLPNCTCYAWGRFWEITGGNTPPSLSTSNAEDWYNYSDGYQRGNTPKLGAIICFADGPFSGDGHVAVVEQINGDGSIVTSNSAYGGQYFYTQTLQPPNYLPTSGYVFQGFIYNPNSQGDVPPEPTNWIYGNYYLSQSERDSNAIKFYYTMSRLGCSYNAILGMLANIDHESTVNPGLWESFIEYWRGYGLVQWSPYTKYSEWAGSDWQNNGQKQCERIIYEAENGLQWFGNPSAPEYGYPYEPPISLLEYLSSTVSPTTLGAYWLLYYEHPGEIYIEDRLEEIEELVNHYNSVLNGGGPIPPVPPTPTESSRFIYYCNKRKFMKRRNARWR